MQLPMLYISLFVAVSGNTTAGLNVLADYNWTFDASKLGMFDGRTDQSSGYRKQGQTL